MLATHRSSPSRELTQRLAAIPHAYIVLGGRGSPAYTQLLSWYQVAALARHPSDVVVTRTQRRDSLPSRTRPAHEDAGSSGFTQRMSWYLLAALACHPSVVDDTQTQRRDSPPSRARPAHDEARLAAIPHSGGRQLRLYTACELVSGCSTCLRPIGPCRHNLTAQLII